MQTTSVARRGRRAVRLDEFQEALSRRIGAASSVVQKDLRLGVSVGGVGWLLNLPDAGEVIPVPTITPVPMTRSWLLGVANVRGRLYSVTDLAAFFGAAPTQLEPRTRLLLVGQRYDSHAAILVERVLGLRSIADLSPLPPGDGQWVSGEFSDPQGQHWRELDLPRLLAAGEFSAVAD